MFMPFFFVNGCGGGSWVFASLATASLTDTTDSKAGRSYVIAVFMAIFYACGAIGPLLGGQLTKHAGELFPQTPQCTHWCHGGELQTTMLLFFVTNVLLVLLVLFGFGESIAPVELQQARAELKGKSYAWWALQPSLKPLRTIFSTKGKAWCAFSNRTLHSRMPFLSGVHCSYRCHHKSCPNTEGVRPFHDGDDLLVARCSSPLSNQITDHDGGGGTRCTVLVSMQEFAREESKRVLLGFMLLLRLQHCHACDPTASSRAFTLLPVDTVNPVTTLQVLCGLC
jgi:hypothetical protein